MYTFAIAKYSHFECEGEWLQANVHTCVATTAIKMKESSIIPRLLHAFCTELNAHPRTLNSRTNDGKWCVLPCSPYLSLCE